VKARNHSRVAKALPYSEDIAYTPPCGEIAVCLRVGRMRPISDDGPGHYNPDPSEGLWGGGVNSSRRCVIESASDTERGYCARAEHRRDNEMHEERMQTE